LEDIKIPIRLHQDADLDNHSIVAAASVASGISSIAFEDGVFGEQSILKAVSRDDLQRYFIASDCSLRTAAVRTVESAVWRAITFPIDIRSCRVELQSGQFFQQGEDLDGNPVFYFRNTCLGPWRKDDDAAIAAVLHRLESRLSELSFDDPAVQCTLIVMMGRPFRRNNRAIRNEANLSPSKHSSKNDLPDVSIDQETVASAGFSMDMDGQSYSSDEGPDDDDEGETFEDEGFDEALRLAQTNNPRVFRDEVWNTHTSKKMIARMIDILLAHYPERLSKALVVVGHKNKRYVRSTVGGVLAMSSLVNSSRTRNKVKFLSDYQDLQSYVDRSQLITLVGGLRRENMQHYECK